MMAEPGSPTTPKGMRMRRWLLPAAVTALLAAGAAGGYLARLPQVNAVWVPVVAALGASLLTTVAVFGVEVLRHFNACEKQRRQERRDAYSKFLAASAQFISLASELDTIRRLAAGIRPQVRIDDPLEWIHRVNRESLQPLLIDAWSAVWLAGSSEAIAAANRMLEATKPAMSTATAEGTAIPWLLRRFLGQPLTKEQEQSFRKALARVGVLRKEFADVARPEMGEPVADLFAAVDRGETQESPAGSQENEG